MTAAPSYDVFLTHNSADKAAVEILAARLRQADFAPFLDKWRLIPGEPWQEALEEALYNSETVAVFVGPSGISPWHNAEMRTAIDNAVSKRDEYRVIPVLLPDANEESVRGFLAQRTWLISAAVWTMPRLLSGWWPASRARQWLVGPMNCPTSRLPTAACSPSRPNMSASSSVARPIANACLRDRTPSICRRRRRFGQRQVVVSHAGLLPALAGDALPDSRVAGALVHARQRPLRALAEQLATFAPLAGGDRRRRLTVQRRPSGRWPAHAVGALLAEHPRPVLLVVDQFEELFTLCQEGPERCRAQAEQFVANLADAVEHGDGRIHVLITLRADFLDRCLAFPALRGLLEDRQVLLGPLDEPALREVIVRPAQEVGALFEKGLVNMILRDVAAEAGASALPRAGVVRAVAGAARPLADAGGI